MKTLKFILPAFFILLVMSCKPLVTKTNGDYVGYWESSGANGFYSINIESNSRATYQRLKGATTITSSGKARLKNDKLKIGLMKFEVNQNPTQGVSGEWTMILDNVEYYRY